MSWNCNTEREKEFKLLIEEYSKKMLPCPICGKSLKIEFWGDAFRADCFHEKGLIIGNALHPDFSTKETVINSLERFVEDCNWRG
jgi:hypothetical protein